MKQPESIRKFCDATKRINETVADSLDVLSREELLRISEELKAGHRIYFTASGSSIPAAKFAADFIRANSPFSACFVSTSELVELHSLSSADRVILVSQGFNRSDGIIVQNIAREKGTEFYVFTANVKAEANNIIPFLPPPAEEHLFCRPIGVITSFVAASWLAHLVCGLNFDRDSHERAVDQAVEYRGCVDSRDLALQLFQQCGHMVVLSSGAIYPAAANIALALREGAGIITSSYEIEYFAHGQYAPFTFALDQGRQVGFLLITARDHHTSMRSSDRIKPMLKQCDLPYAELVVPGTASEASVSLLREGSRIVEGLILESGYDMNSPRGKEENRGFQLVPSDYYQR